MRTTNKSTLQIHKLTVEQYKRELAAGRIDEDALYFTVDSSSGDINSAGTYVITGMYYTSTEDFIESVTLDEGFSYNSIVDAINSGLYVVVKLSSDDRLYHETFNISLISDEENYITFQHVISTNHIVGFDIYVDGTVSAWNDVAQESGSNTTVTTDKTLQLADAPADAKAVGDALAAKSSINIIEWEDDD